MDFQGKFLILVILLNLALATTALAGFGIAPPYFTNDRLFPGFHFEKEILLVRGEPIEDLKAEIKINVPKANDWISIDKGKEFILPKGEKQVPMVVKVDVPKNADLGSYEGTIQIRIVSTKPPDPGTIRIALGGQIEVDLDVVKAEIFDFKIWETKLLGSEEGHKCLWFFVPGRIKLEMLIENIGNIKVAPTKVYFDIYDSSEKNLLESAETTKMEKVRPFETKKIVVEIPTKLPPGSYWVSFKIFKKDEAVKEGKLNLNIFARGTLQPIPKEWLGLNIWIWVAIGVGIVAISGIGYGGYRIWKKKKKNKVKKKKKNIVQKKKKKNIVRKKKKKEHSIL
jgi:hypothetical protein